MTAAEVSVAAAMDYTSVAATTTAVTTAMATAMLTGTAAKMTALRVSCPQWGTQTRASICTYLLNYQRDIGK
jgi:hypothetical protein